MDVQKEMSLSKVKVPDTLVDGRLKYFSEFWRSVTHDQEILQYVNGAKIPFVQQPPKQQTIPPNVRMSLTEQKFVDIEIEKLLNKGSIVEISHPPSDGWVSPIFVVPKREKNSFRLILNLRAINVYILYRHFKLINIMDILNILTPNCYLSSVDWHLAFNHIAIRNSDQKFLCFQWCLHWFKYVCHANGQANAPYVINRLCKPLLRALGRQNVNLNLCIDDSLICSKSFEDMQHSIALTLEVFQKAGFLINFKKSVPTPMQKISFLGFDIDTVEFCVSVSLAKHLDLFNMVNRVCSHPGRKVTIRHIAKIIGKIVTMFPASDHAQLHYRALDRFKVCMLILHRSKWTTKVTLSPSALKQLHWWRDNEQTDKMKRSLYLHPPELHLYVDSCNEAWGSVLEGKEIKSVFSHEQQLLHINTKELLAVYYGILSHIAVLTGRFLLFILTM